MSESRRKRLASLHDQFLSATERFPKLSLIAVSESEKPPTLPGECGDIVLSNDFAIGLHQWQWCDLLRRPRTSLFSPIERLKLWLDDEIWVACYYCDGEPWSESDLDYRADEVLKLNQNLLEGIAEFSRLAVMAANAFTRSQPPPHVPFVRDKPEHPWLEQIAEIVPMDENGAFIVRRLGNVFLASANAIEQIQQIEQAAMGGNDAGAVVRLGNASHPANADDKAQGSGESSHGQVAHRLLNVFTGGLADERFGQAASILDDDKLSTGEKLTKIDALLRFPTTVSSRQLGELFRVSHVAVQGTDWWKKNRKGRNAELIGQREEIQQNRAKQHELGRRIEGEE